MIGAILGDIIGSPYEFDRGRKTKDFPLFGHGVHFTDDTVMTIAVGKALLDCGPDASDEFLLEALVKQMRHFGLKYPRAGYGAMFGKWLKDPSMGAYDSFGNGSAMRVSSVAWLYQDLDRVLQVAKLSSQVTHNHPDGIKGAQATAAAIFMARQGTSKQDIKAYVEDHFSYDLSRTCDQIRPF